jgi:simple sugar transport system permease protein
MIRSLAAVIAVFCAAVAVLSALLLAAGFPVAPALVSMWRGAAGTSDAVLSATLVRAVPLLVLGSGILIALRAGVINLGGDGQFLAGAVAAAAITLAMPLPGPISIIIALLFSAAAGGAWAALPAWLKARFETLEVVSTIMMNFLAAFLVSYLVRGPLQEPTGVYPQSSALPAGSHLPIIVPGSRLHAGVVLAAVAVTVAWLLLERTENGFRIRAVGSNPQAAAVAGEINVRRVQLGAFLASGVCAGVAGGIEVLGVTYAVYENLSPGYGYTAIAVALLAGLRPIHLAWSATLLGALAAGATAMQRDAGVPAGVASVVEATMVLALLGGHALLRRGRFMRPAEGAVS